MKKVHVISVYCIYIYLKTVDVQNTADFLNSLFRVIHQQVVILQYFYNISFALEPSARLFARLQMSFQLKQTLGLVHEAAQR